MPKVPQYQESQRFGNAPDARFTVNGRALASALGGETWGAVDRAGRQMRATGEQMGGIALDLMREHNETVAMDHLNRAEAAILDMQTEQALRKGRDALGDAVASGSELIAQAAGGSGLAGPHGAAAGAGKDGKSVGVTGTLRAGLDKLRVELAQGMNPAQQKLFDLAFTRREQGVMRWGAGWEAQQREVYTTSTEDGKLAVDAQRALANYGDREQVEAALGNTLFVLERRGKRLGLAPEAVEAQRTEASQKLLLPLFDAMLDKGELAQARQYVQVYGGILGAGTATAVQAKIRARADALRAKAEAERKKAEAEAEKAALKGAVDGILADVDAFPTLEEQKEAAFARADALPDPALRDKARTEIKQELAWRETRRDATTAREKRQFQELARQQGWTPRQAADQLDKAEGLSERAREDLRNDFDGRAERQTPANKAALAELRTLVDLGPERGGIDPKDADAIDAYVYRHGLTYEQGLHAHKYAEQGGMAGEVTQTQINRVFKALFPKLNAKDVPEDLFDLVGGELRRVAPGKAATDAEVRSAMARLYVEGETEGAGRFTWGVGKDESRMEALRQGRGKDWSPDGEVPAEDAARIETLLRESGVEPTPGRVRRYYWEEQGGKA